MTPPFFVRKQEIDRCDYDFRDSFLPLGHFLFPGHLQCRLSPTKKPFHEST